VVWTALQVSGVHAVWIVSGSGRTVSPLEIGEAAGDALASKVNLVRAHHASNGSLRQTTVATLSRALPFSRTART
jgi:hypothetical protein